MTQTGYTNAIVNALLGWLKGLASWVLKLFNLSGGFSPLKFLANNWLKLLIFFLIVGVAVDLLVWLIRWRPHWVWFRKKRVIINDANFFASEKTYDVDAEQEKLPRGARPKRDWVDSNFVVPSAERRRRAEEQRRRRAGDGKSAPARAEREDEEKDVFTDGMFNVNAKQRFSDKYEDEVFRVNDLPLGDAADARRQRRQVPEQRGRTDAVRRAGYAPRQLRDEGAQRGASKRRKPASASAARRKTAGRGRRP